MSISRETEADIAEVKRYFGPYPNETGKAALRLLALFAEGTTPPTCSTCKWWTEKDGHPKRAVCAKNVCGPGYGYSITPDDFGCTLWEASL